LTDTSESEKLRPYIDCVIEQASLVYTQLGFPFIKKMYKNVSIMEEEVLESAVESSNTQPTKKSTIVGGSSSTQSSDPHRRAPKRPITNKPTTPISDTTPSAQPPRHESSVSESV
jgi:hypothetical protein